MNPVPLLGLVFLLAGCGAARVDTFPSTERILEAGQFAERRPLAGPDAFTVATDARIAEILARPLAPEDAVEIAMLRDPDLQRIYGAHQQYGDSVVAALKRQSASDAPMEIRAIRAALVKTMAATDPIGFAEIYVDTAGRFLEIGAQVRRAYWNAVAQQALAALEQDAAKAARAAAMTANEQFRAGTLARAEQAALVLAAARADRSLRRAERDLLTARESLIQALGLWGGETAFTLPDGLPEPPASLPALPDLEARAVTRLDMLAARGLGDGRMRAARARSEARAAHADWVRAHADAVQIRDAMLPAQQAAMAEIQRRYNAMLVDLYTLLGAVRQGLELRQEYVAALRDYHLAEIALEVAIGAPRLALVTDSTGEKQ